jgi:hypothetical protein
MNPNEQKPGQFFKIRAASKAAADNRSRASSQDKAASRVASRNLGKAVNRLSAEFG